jgi:hypothetical protein
MIDKIKPVESLTVADLEASPVWQYMNSDGGSETRVRPVKKIPVKSLTGKIIGTRVLLANGLRVWALIGNVDATNPRFTEHFLTLSIGRGGKWFALARYHDHDFTVRGPDALSRFLGLEVDDVFPISVDVRQHALGNPAALAVNVPKEAREKLTRADIVALAVP